MTFYDRVKGLCDRDNVKISNLAREMHLSASAPSNWRDGTYPKVETVIRLADRFNVSTDYLLRGDKYDISTNETLKVCESSLNYSAIAQGNANSYVHVENGGNGQPELSEMEQELLDNFGKLSTKAKIEVLNTVYKLAGEN